MKDGVNATMYTYTKLSAWEEVGSKVIREVMEGDGTEEAMERDSNADGAEFERVGGGLVENEEVSGMEGSGDRGGNSAIKEEL